MLGNWTNGIEIKELNWTTKVFTKVLCLFLEYKCAYPLCALIFLYINELHCRDPPQIHCEKSE